MKYSAHALCDPSFVYPSFKFDEDEKFVPDLTLTSGSELSPTSSDHTITSPHDALSPLTPATLTLPQTSTLHGLGLQNVDATKNQIPLSDTVKSDYNSDPYMQYSGLMLDLAPSFDFSSLLAPPYTAPTAPGSERRVSFDLFDAGTINPSKVFTRPDVLANSLYFDAFDAPTPPAAVGDSQGATNGSQAQASPLDSFTDPHSSSNKRRRASPDPAPYKPRSGPSPKRRYIADVGSDPIAFPALDLARRYSADINPYLPTYFGCRVRPEQSAFTNDVFENLQFSCAQRCALERHGAATRGAIPPLAQHSQMPSGRPLYMTDLPFEHGKDNARQLSISCIQCGAGIMQVTFRQRDRIHDANVQLSPAFLCGDCAPLDASRTKRRKLEKGASNCDICFKRVAKGALNATARGVPVELKPENNCNRCLFVYLRCSDCGGGGSRLGVGKQRCACLFVGKKKTCVVWHVRPGRPEEMTYSVAPVASIDHKERAYLARLCALIFLNTMLNVTLIPDVLEAPDNSMHLPCRDFKEELRQYWNVLERELMSGDGNVYLALKFCHGSKRNNTYMRTVVDHLKPSQCTMLTHGIAPEGFSIARHYPDTGRVVYYALAPLTNGETRSTTGLLLEKLTEEIRRNATTPLTTGYYPTILPMKCRTNTMLKNVAQFTEETENPFVIEDSKLQWKTLSRPISAKSHK